MNLATLAAVLAAQGCITVTPRAAPSHSTEVNCSHHHQGDDDKDDDDEKPEDEGDK